MPLKTLDLFCGAGGFSYGLHQTNFETDVGIDIDEDAVETFRHNLDSYAFCVNLAAHPPEDILDLLSISPDDVDVVVGGPPCKKFSQMSSEEDPDALRSLIQTFLDFVKILEPRAYVMENVTGLKRRFPQYLEAFLDRSDALNYKTDYQILDASHYGIPQGRNRLFVVGIHDSEGVEYEWPEPTTEDSPPVAGSVLLGGALPKDNWPNSKTSTHKSDVVDSWHEDGYKSDPYGDNRHQIRLHPDEPAWTVVEHSHFHPEKPRALTAREEASLQTFPRWYHFAGGMVSASAQVGNAVPPKLATHVGSALLESLGEPTQYPTESVGMTMKQIADLGGRLTEREVESLLLRSADIQWEEVGDVMDIEGKTAANLSYRAEEKLEEAKQTIRMYERLTKNGS